jgi:hypothetical protein
MPQEIPVLMGKEEESTSQGELGSDAEEEEDARAHNLSAAEFKDNQSLRRVKDIELTDQSIVEEVEPHQGVGARSQRRAWW